MNYAKLYQGKNAPQSQPVPGKPMVQNNAGGYGFAIDKWAQLDRFLILGSSTGTYYVAPQKLTRENAECVLECAKEDATRAIVRIVEVSKTGLAPKNDAAIFALALVGSVHPQANAQMHEVCRTGMHLFQWYECTQSLRGHGHSVNAAVRRWYESKEPRDLAYQLSKYQQRNGWSHRDLLRLAKPKPKDEAHSSAYRWAVGKDGELSDELAPIVAFEKAKRASTAKEVAQIIRDYRLVRECVPTQFLNSAEVWEALLEQMPLHALVRNLGKMSAVGLLKPLSDAARFAERKLRDGEAILRARLHPFSILVAMKTYASGHGQKGSLSWTACQNVIDALNDAFYLAFQSVVPTGKRILIGVDVSGSMGTQTPLGLTFAECSGAMAMTFVRTESQVHVLGFADQFRDLGISKSQRLDDVTRRCLNSAFGRTDCAVPMLFAALNGIPVDTFLVITDNETWAGGTHPFIALQQYRNKMGIDAKSVVMGMAATPFTIADPSDPGMLDVVGMDTSVPKVVADFARGSSGAAVDEAE